MNLSITLVLFQIKDGDSIGKTFLVIAHHMDSDFRWMGTCGWDPSWPPSLPPCPDYSLPGSTNSLPPSNIPPKLSASEFNLVAIVGLLPTVASSVTIRRRQIQPSESPGAPSSKHLVWSAVEGKKSILGRTGFPPLLAADPRTWVVGRLYAFCNWNKYIRHFGQIYFTIGINIKSGYCGGAVAAFDRRTWVVGRLCLATGAG